MTKVIFHMNFFFILFGLNRKVHKETIQNKGLCIIKALEMFDNFVHF